MNRYRPARPWAKSATALIVAAMLSAAVGVAETDEIRAESTLWVYGHHSGTGYRVADLRRDTSRRKEVAEEFGRRITFGYAPWQIRVRVRIRRTVQRRPGQIIAIVNAFHYPTAAADLQHFSERFGLPGMFGLPGTSPCTVAAGPHPCFEVLFAQGSQPPVDQGWALESALDTQWAHAIAPGVDILLVRRRTTGSVASWSGSTWRWPPGPRSSR